MAAPRGGGLGAQKSAKIVKEKWHKLVGYTFKMKNTPKSPPLLSDFSELAPPLFFSSLLRNQVTFERKIPGDVIRFSRASLEQLMVILIDKKINSFYKCRKKLIDFNTRTLSFQIYLILALFRAQRMCFNCFQRTTYFALPMPYFSNYLPGQLKQGLKL